MKNNISFKSLGTIFLVFFLLTGFTYASAPLEPNSKTIQQLIQENLKYPAFAKKYNYQESVEVIFSVSKDGKLRIKEIRTEDADVKAYIVKEFSGLCCEDIRLTPTKEYKVVLKFKLL